MNRKIAVLIFIITFFFLGCDIIYRRLDKKGSEEKELIGEVIPFEKNPTVEEIQTLLDLYGYGPGKIDGKMGENTRKAVERFQKDHNLEVTRKVDQTTWQKLSVFKEKELIVDNKLNSSLIQTLLIKAGYNPGTVDGKIGPKTIAAVKKFQKDHKLKVDGKIGYQTLSALAVYLEEPIIEGQDK